MWFDGWSEVGRVVAVGGTAYVVLVVMLRLSGKRTLSKLNAFDLVVTVAMGSTLSAALLSSDVSLAEAAAGFGVLVLGQFVVAWLARRWRSFSHVVKSTPALLLWQGRMLEDALDRERVTRAEVRSAIRGAGLARLEDAGAVVLETDGSLQVLRAGAISGSLSALQDVRGLPEQGEPPPAG
jgi:uncharacterized membrane protein YcaP (DUF421 family)